MDTINGHITYGSTFIAYKIEYVQRKTLGIVVYPDGSVVLKAPIGVSIEEINKKLEKPSLMRASEVKKK